MIFNTLLAIIFGTFDYNINFPKFQVIIKIHFIIVFLFLFSTNEFKAQEKVTVDYRTFGALEARHIGPARMSGRISALDAWHKDPKLLYVGSAGGGVWKSENGGVTFTPVFEEHIMSIGAVRIDQQRPDTVWVGTGEPWTRNSVSVGGGVYKTTDGGKTWKKLGLELTERTARIEIDPENPNVVYVAALGQLWGSNEERGVYRTTDGGESWERVLYIDENTGCSDLSLDHEEPNIIYAGMWDFRRSAYDFRSGGPGSNLYISRDGGDNWVKAILPQVGDTIGRIAVDVSPPDPDRVFALVETDTSALYRSDDKGLTWERVNTSNTVGQRPFYFCYIVADPDDKDKIYKPGTSLSISRNGGESFPGGGGFGGGGGFHSDVHAIWISEKDPDFIYMGTDGGVYISNDGASTWRIIRNLPVSQFYHVSADNELPYNVYGGLQDNGSWMGPSSSVGGIENGDWQNLGGGDGFYVFPDLSDPNIVYWQSQGGNIQRLYKNTREVRSIRPSLSDDTTKLRWNWNSSVSFGDHGRTIYVGSQFLFKSTDKGENWERISGDLTTNNPEKLKQDKSGGVTIDNTGAENHCTIITINESPLNSQIIWVGTDDGQIQVTQDGGAKWENLTMNVPGLPGSTWCSYVEPSRASGNRIYATFDGHKQGDMNAYVYRSDDMGKSWTLINKGIDSYCHVIKEDPLNSNLIYLGTEHGLYISIDGGEVWSRFTGNLPKVAIRDMFIHPREHDLILASHGLGIIIIDDISPLRQLSQEALNKEVAFLSSRPYVLRSTGFQQTFGGNDEYVGANPEQANLITYCLKKRHIFGDMHIEVYDENNNLINELPAGKRKGINRVVLSIRKDPPKTPESARASFGAVSGPSLLPGKYIVKIVKNDEVTEGYFTIARNPASPHSVADMEMQHQLVMKTYQAVDDFVFLDRKINKLKTDCESVAKELKDESLKDNLTELVKNLSDLRGEMVAKADPGASLFGSGGEQKVWEELIELYGNINSYSGRPSDTQVKQLDKLLITTQELNKRFTQLTESLDQMNADLQKSDRDRLVLFSREEYDMENK